MMSRQDLIADAVGIVRLIEEEVKSRLFPAWDEDMLEHHSSLQVRYRACVDNAVRVYCAHQNVEVREVIAA